MVKKYIIRDVMVIILAILLSSGYASTATNTLEEYTDDIHFIASRGNLPDTVDQEWKIVIQDCWLNITSPSYDNFDESIKSIGNRNGVLTVYLKSAYKKEINDSQIDEIYQKIESYCEENSDISNVPVVFMWAEDEEDLTFEYNPNAFESIKKDSDYIASRGTVPVFEDEKEWMKWSDAVFEARHINELDQYYASQGGPLLSYGFKKYSGYIEVGVNKNTPEKITDSSIDEVYQIIAEHYEKEGISDIPVVFMLYYPPTEESTGFTSVMLILCILILIRIRR
ncbi:hypothetical protein [Methanolobus profundi]|uniref:Uncharacterized protein n=1 Tax=Methanolobus profundi TaxID=487685 RepID=A0A1I4UMB2_9EURY|nr:hypothetical protein [Methanolobus profundi]SFM90122.1 hypothetical protein SAMN04488696_2789 [Methanolobus profundi]